MKLLYVVKIFPKLSETFILDQITHLIDRGHDVRILSYLCPEEIEPKDSLVDAKIHKYALLAKTHYFRNLVESAADYIQMKRTLGLEITPHLANLARQADVIVAHCADMPAQIAAQLSVCTGVPFVFVAHARDIFVELDIQMFQDTARHAARIIVPTEYNARFLSNAIGSDCKAKTEIVRYGIDLGHFSCDRSRRQSRDRVAILSVGRLVEKKGMLDSLAAFAAVRQQHPHIEMRIVGDGPLRAEIAKQIYVLGISKHVTLLGDCQHAEVKEEMENADIFILPSVRASDGDREGLPLVILEAAAMGLPVVSTLHTGIPEGVIDGKTGFLVSERDVEQLASRLGALVENESLRREMGREGRMHVECSFNMTVEIEKLIAILSETAERFNALGHIDDRTPCAVGRH